MSRKMKARQSLSARRLAGLLVFVALPGSWLAGCAPETEKTGSRNSMAGASPSGPSAEQMAQWKRNCALCHVRGEGGAPVLGDTKAWKARLAQGEDVLLAHTVEGLNNMPPLGYCMDCEEADFRALIRFMAGVP